MILAGGCIVTPPEPEYATDGTRRLRRPIARATGAAEICQTISAYGRGMAPAWRNRESEEVLYVAAGRGVCRVDGHPAALEPGTALFVPPGCVAEIENPGEAPLEVVSVCCPEEAPDRVEAPPCRAAGSAPRLTVLESEVEPMPAGNRTFKVLIDGHVGCRRVTQFVGLIPPGRAPMHHHAYEEAIYILEGRGIVWTDAGAAPFAPGSSIYLSRGVRHALENDGAGAVRLLGVFYPSGSPAVSYT